MDRNSIIGLLIIGGILVGWMVWSKPSKEELERIQFQKDSIANVQLAEQVKKEALSKTIGTTVPHVAIDSNLVNNDSIASLVKNQIYGDFANTLSNESKTITVENDFMKIHFSSKGGRVASVELKKYKTFDGKPLVMFHADSSLQGIVFNTNNKTFSSDSLVYATESTNTVVTGKDSKTIIFRLYTNDHSKYLEYIYSIKGDDYMIGYRLNFVGLQNIISSRDKTVQLSWSMKTPSQEKSISNQHSASTIYYKPLEDNVDYISATSDEKLSLEDKTKWIGFKQQFFTSSIVADNGFEKGSEVETKTPVGSNMYVRDFNALLLIPYNHQPSETFGMSMYFGPNHYKTLKSYDIALEGQIDLGWKIFGWINRFLVIPVFNFLDGFNLNYGIIILLLTILLKILLLPIAYKTILSSAKMKVLKPEIDELNEKHKNDDPLKKQQATMALYKQAGVNPMAGCIPVLLQMPILIALFRFFPASIELRGQSFLWAHDLSTYDSIWNFGFNIPFYGDHMSLFALLMTASTLLYTWSNSQLMGTSNQMPGMKWMMYLMPVLFLGFMNSYSSGLSWYYFLANMITFLQTWIIQKYVIDHDALHAKIQANKLKPKKVSKFQQKLEEMQKQNQTRLTGKK